MVGFLKHWLVALYIGEGAGQENTNVFGSVYGLADGFVNMRKLISGVEELEAKGLMERHAYPLSPPRHDYGVTGKTMQHFLPHSTLAACTSADMEANKCFCAGDFEEAAVFRNETLDAQAVVGADVRNKLIVVSYRYTVSTRNFEVDNDNVLVSYPAPAAGVKVHRGNLRYFLSLHHQMVSKVYSLLARYRGYTLHLTGYSLGAPVSAISLPVWRALLQSQGLPNRVQVYMYAGPRPGNLEFATYLESLDVPIVRYTRQGDPVPLTPDQSLGFSHVGQEFYDASLPFIGDSVVKCSPNLVEDPECALKDKSLFVTSHLIPFQKILPLLPTCDQTM